MSHTIRQKPKLLARVRRIKGQIEAIERALENELPCFELLQLMASVRGAMNGLTTEVIEDHLREHVLASEDAEERQQGGEQLLGVLRTYMK